MTPELIILTWILFCFRIPVPVNTMKIIALLGFLSYASAFIIPQPSYSRVPATTQLNAAPSEASAESNNNVSSRRDMLFKAAGVATTLTFLPSSARADGESTEAPPSTSIRKVVVAGATGQTGGKVLSKLMSDSQYTVTGGVRNIQKASKSLGSTGASLTKIDVVEDSFESLTSSLEGADGLIIACGMNPGKNLLRMAAAAHEVDNVGTCKLIDAAKKAGVKKVVLVSSILTNGRAWGQEDSPGFKITNAFGNALDEKLEAEKYLRASGLDYTIVRPGGLQAKAPVGALSINEEDTLNSGEISRDLVADVCITSLNDPKAKNKVLEIIEEGTQV